MIRAVSENGIGSFEDERIIDGSYTGFVNDDPIQDSIVIREGDELILFSNYQYSPGTVITVDTGSFTFCFLPGTLIATPSGEVAVEALAIGDPILTADGRTIPVRWIGRQALFTAFGLPEGRTPVLIQAGALAPGVPCRDLRVTAGPAMILDGIAVEAGALVNGSTIRRIPRAELGARLTVFHIETEGHEVILAEGAPSETYLGHMDRAQFDNGAEHAALYGEAAIEEMPLPRAMSRRQVLPPIQARIAARAAALMEDKQAA